jgi:hypothetical protein
LSAAKESEADKPQTHKGKPVVWTPLPKQSEAISAPEREVLFGGSLGGSKTDTALIIAIEQIDNPAHRALFLRRSFPQLRDAIDRAHALYTPLGGVYNVQTSTFKFPKTGAKVEFAFADSDSDRFRYTGRSWNTIIFDELCEWPTDLLYTHLLTRLRTTKNSGVRLRVFATGNPLGPGSGWVRSRWRIPGDGSASTCVDEETGFHRRFIPARLADNVYLLGSDYERMLQALPSAQKKALLDGRWDAVAGAVFEEFSHAKHVVEPFAIPCSWDIWRGCDPGFRAPSAVLWAAWDKDGTDSIYIIREIFEAQLTPELLAEKIRRIDFSIPVDLGDGAVIANDERLTGVIDSAAFSDTGMGSVGDELNKRGGKWKPAEKGQNSRIGGINMIHERLATRSDGTVGLKIFKNCPALIAELPSLVYDPNGGEDIDQNCASDHCFDCLRYLLTYKKPWTRVVKVHWAH